MYSAWLKKKPVVVNAALSRAYEDTVFQASKLKTAKGQDKRVLAFFDHCADMPELDANNLRYLQGLIRKHMDSIS